MNYHIPGIEKNYYKLDKNGTKLKIKMEFIGPKYDKEEMKIIKESMIDDVKTNFSTIKLKNTVFSLKNN